MPDIFLSYSREDRDRAERFAGALEASGYDVWWDGVLKAGEVYDQVTETALAAAKAVVVLWSRGSVDSRSVRAEAAVAQRRGALLPVMIEDCTRPVMFELVQTANLVGWTGEAEAPDWLGFVEDLRAHLDRLSRAGSVSAGPPAAERRQVAVLSSGLSSADGADDVDPEDWQETVQGFRATAHGLLADFDCQLIQTGAALTAIFGLDRSREDDALRAVRAALALSGAFAKRPGSPMVRIGVEFGPIVAGAPERAPAGPALENAAQLQAQAEPGEVLIGDPVARLAGGFLKLEARGPRAFAVLAESDVRSRFDLSRARGLSRFVGREEVIDVLLAALQTSAAKTGEVVGVVADAGGGKSRLCFEFAERCRAMGHEVFTASATLQNRHAPLHLVRAMLRAFFGVGGADAAATARRKIESRTLELDSALEASLPLIFDLLDLADPERPAPPIDPDARPRQLLALTRHLLGLASAAKATVIILEDLHWLDDASAAFLEELVESHEGLRNLLVLNYRPEFRAAWMQTSHSRQIALSPLSDDAVGRLLGDLLGEDAGLAQLAAEISARTKGNPYFIEEVVETLAETGRIEGRRGHYSPVGAVGELEIPPTVKAVVLARIDRLDHRDREVLQLAAVIGSQCPASLLQAVSGLSEPELSSAIAALRRAEFIVERATFPVPEYAFRHPLTLEIALASLLKTRRRELHGRVARILEAEPDAAARPDLLAHHWDEAGESLPAAQWRLKAAAQAVRTDFTTAGRHWRRVLDLCADIEDGPGALLFVEAASQLLTGGYRLGMELEEGRALMARGEALIGPDGPAVLRLVLSICFSRLLCVAGDVDGYVELSQENHRAAMETGDLQIQVFAKARLCDACGQSGLHVQGVVEAEAAMALYPKDLPRPEWMPDWHPWAFFAFMRGNCLVWVGRPAEAEAQLREVIQFATDDGSPEVVGWASYQLSLASYLMGEGARALEAAQRVREISDRLGSPLMVSFNRMAQVRAGLATGEFEKALAEARAASEMFNHVERHWAPVGRMLQARCLLELGRAEEAVELADQAVQGFTFGSIRHFEIESWGVLARAQLRWRGAAALAEAERALANAERLIDTYGIETMRPFLCEWRAELAQAKGDLKGRTSLLDRAAKLHAEQGAPSQAERVRSRGDVVAG